MCLRAAFLVDVCLLSGIRRLFHPSARTVIIKYYTPTPGPGVPRGRCYMDLWVNINISSSNIQGEDVVIVMYKCMRGSRDK